MSAETPTNPYSAFEKMTDEEVVLKACVPKPEVIF